MEVSNTYKQFEQEEAEQQEIYKNRHIKYTLGHSTHNLLNICMPKLKLLFADDDPDDRIFFQDALEELPVEATLTTVNDGVELMNKLTADYNNLPDLIFLDLNMPRKNGFDCLTEIMNDDKLKRLPVVIYSTSSNTDVVNMLYDLGAQNYIRKPGEFSKIKKVIHDALLIFAQHNPARPPRDKFVLQ